MTAISKSRAPDTKTFEHWTFTLFAWRNLWSPVWCASEWAEHDCKQTNSRLFMSVGRCERTHDSTTCVDIAVSLIASTHQLSLFTYQFGSVIIQCSSRAVDFLKAVARYHFDSVLVGGGESNRARLMCGQENGLPSKIYESLSTWDLVEHKIDRKIA